MGATKHPSFLPPGKQYKGLDPSYEKAQGFAQAGSALLQSVSFSSAPSGFGTSEARIAWTFEGSPRHKSPWADGRNVQVYPGYFWALHSIGNTGLRKRCSLSRFLADLQFLSY